MDKKSTASILGVKVQYHTMDSAIRLAGEYLGGNQFHQAVTIGPEFILEATAHPKFKTILNNADLVLVDGVGLKIAAFITGQAIPPRVTGVDFTQQLIKLAAHTEKSVFLFGGRPGVAERTARSLIKQYPKLRIVGVENGSRGTWQKIHDRRIAEKIHLAKPHILLVAMGAPKQELWIAKHRHWLHDVRIAVGVGRTFDYLAGDIKLPPTIMRRVGLEWLYTYLYANKLYQPGLRRQRVRNATYHFLKEVVRHGRQG